LATAAIVSSISSAVAIGVQARLADRQIATANLQIETASASAKSQLTATVVSTNRQAWINGLRDEISEVLTLVDGFQRHMRALLPSREKSEEVQQQRFEYEQRANLALNKIRLRVNEEETDCRDLVGFLQIAVSDMKVDGVVREHIVKTGQRILKAEWERVKRLE
jgi:hypothetical protein